VAAPEYQAFESTLIADAAQTTRHAARAIDRLANEPEHRRPETDEERTPLGITSLSLINGLRTPLAGAWACAQTISRQRQCRLYGL
jgi:hypothetical protein